MFLSDKTIKRFLKEKKIVVRPGVKEADIRAVGIRVHLAQEILVPRPNQTVDLANPGEIKYKKINLNKKEFTLKPGEFILGAIVERRN